MRYAEGEVKMAKMSPDQFVEFVTAVIRCLPREADADVIQGWIANQKGLTEALNKALLPQNVYLGLTLKKMGQEEAEARLGRPLEINEVEFLEFFNEHVDHPDVVQSRLNREGRTGMGSDFLAFMTDCVEKARARWDTRKAWSVTIPGPVWDRYARESRETRTTITECIVAAILRDYRREMVGRTS